MHDAVRDYARETLLNAGCNAPAAVLDIGGRDVNGTLRDLFPASATYHALDARPASNVDIVADAASWAPGRRRYDVVLCTEVFEHTPEWRAILVTAYRALRKGGRLIVTCAGIGRAPHSAIEATALQPGEFYENLNVVDLTLGLRAAGFDEIEVAQVGLDLQGTAVRV